MNRLRLLILGCLLLVTRFASANILHAEIKNHEALSRFSVATEVSNIKVEDESINSFGAKIAYQLGIYKGLDLDISLSSTLMNDEGVKPGVTTFGLYGFYSFFNQSKSARTVFVDGKTFIIETVKQGDQLRAGLGIEQAFISGNQGVYNMAGPGAIIEYDREFRGKVYFVGFRLAQLNSGDLKVLSTVLNLGMRFNM